MTNNSIYSADPSGMRYLRVSGVLGADQQLLLRPSYLSGNARNSTDIKDSPLKVALYAGTELLLEWGALLGTYADVTGPGARTLEAGVRVARDPQYRPVRAKIPFPKGTDRIVYRFEGRTTLEVKVPAHAPEITALQVERCDKSFHISWTATHVDGLPLMSHVRTSADAGKTWRRIASRLRKSELEIDDDELVGGDACLIEVTAYDGVNTVSRSTPVSDAGPVRLEVEILPGTGIDQTARGTIEVHVQARLRGVPGFSANDAHIRWYAGDVQIGSGPCLLWYDPSAGKHTIRVEAKHGKLVATDELVLDVVD